MTKTKNKTYFAHRIDRWDHTGENLIEHLAGVDDFDLAMATTRRLTRHQLH